MWEWDQSKGTISHDGKYVSNGYSGLNAGKNNPKLQDAKGIGPIPCGMWNITTVYNSPHTGPFTIVLAPQPGTNTFNRSAFRIHGDTITNPGTASHGCIILPRNIREQIWNSGDHQLSVIQ